MCVCVNTEAGVWLGGGGAGDALALRVAYVSGSPRQVGMYDSAKQAPTPTQLIPPKAQLALSPGTPAIFRFLHTRLYRIQKFGEYLRTAPSAQLQMHSPLRSHPTSDGSPPLIFGGPDSAD